MDLKSLKCLVESLSEKNAAVYSEGEQLKIYLPVLNELKLITNVAELCKVDDKLLCPAEIIWCLQFRLDRWNTILKSFRIVERRMTRQIEVIEDLVSHLNALLTEFNWGQFEMIRANVGALCQKSLPDKSAIGIAERIIECAKNQVGRRFAIDCVCIGDVVLQYSIGNPDSGRLRQLTSSAIKQWRNGDISARELVVILNRVIRKVDVPVQKFEEFARELQDIHIIIGSQKLDDAKYRQCNLAVSSNIRRLQLIVEGGSDN
ncbi:MAG: hypothetical protein Q8M16_12260 [Pirellulaceae bacterium]|nr:hypothetical protein [Pirellulaceae bacterium]